MHIIAHTCMKKAFCGGGSMSKKGLLVFTFVFHENEK